MFGALRTAISVIFIASLTWAAFTVDLGRHTFAEHVDRISETREAKQLMKGTRERVNPALEEAKQRVLGEHIEAPTAIKGESSLPAATAPEAVTRPEAIEPKPAARARKKKVDEKARASRASDASSTRLPGRG